MSASQNAALESIAFLGDILGPLFLYSPADTAIQPIREAIVSLNVGDAAVEWPFVETEVANDALRLMHDSLASDDDEAILDDYNRLFEGPERKLTPPWGSVYTDRDMITFGDSSLALSRWMRERGIRRFGAENNPDDHIGLMLMMMSWIARERPELLDEYLEEHLLTWAPHFLEQVIEASESSFYQGTAMLCLASLQGVKEELNLDVKTPRFYR